VSDAALSSFPQGSTARQSGFSTRRADYRHFNLAQGAVITAQGIGAALSTSLAGLVVVHAGYSAAFLVLAGIAAAGFLLYFFGMPETRDLAEKGPDEIATVVQTR
jgi:MFS family permease